MQDLPIYDNFSTTWSTQGYSERHTKRTSGLSGRLPTNKMGYESLEAKRGERRSSSRFRRRGSLRVRPVLDSTYFYNYKTNEIDQHPYQHLLGFTDYSLSQPTDL